MPRLTLKTIELIRADERKRIGEQAVAVKFDDKYVTITLPRGIIPEPITLRFAGKSPTEESEKC